MSAINFEFRMKFIEIVPIETLIIVLFFYVQFLLADKLLVYFITKYLFTSFCKK